MFALWALFESIFTALAAMSFTLSPWVPAVHIEKVTATEVFQVTVFFLLGPHAHKSNMDQESDNRIDYDSGPG